MARHGGDEGRGEVLQIKTKCRKGQRECKEGGSYRDRGDWEEGRQIRGKEVGEGKGVGGDKVRQRMMNGQTEKMKIKKRRRQRKGGWLGRNDMEGLRFTKNCFRFP